MATVNIQELTKDPMKFVYESNFENIMDLINKLAKLSLHPNQVKIIMVDSKRILLVLVLIVLLPIKCRLIFLITIILNKKIIVHQLFQFFKIIAPFITIIKIYCLFIKKITLNLQNHLTKAHLKIR